MKAEEVGYRIAQARKKQGMTQRELSERLHVSDKAVSKWERGVNYPDISLFDEIAKTLDLSLVELLGIEDRSKEEIVQNISEISKYEKEKIGKEIYQRGFVTIICGMIVLAGQLSAALIFAQNEVPGAGILCTSGMMCFTGLMIANGLYTISHAKKLYKNNSITNRDGAAHAVRLGAARDWPDAAGDVRPAAVGLLPYTIPSPALSDRHLFAGRAGRHGVSSGGAAGGHDAAVPAYGGIRRRAGKRRRAALPRHGAGCTAAPPAASCRHRHAASGAMGKRPALAVFRPGVAQPLSGSAGCAEPPRHGNFPLPRPHAAALHAG